MGFGDIQQKCSKIPHFLPNRHFLDNKKVIEQTINLSSILVVSSVNTFLKKKKTMDFLSFLLYVTII